MRAGKHERVWHEKHAVHIILALIFFVLVGFTASRLMGDGSLTGHATKIGEDSPAPTGLPVCMAGFDNDGKTYLTTGNELSKTKLKACAKHYDLIVEELIKAKLSYVDPMLITALAYQESGCNANVNKGGLLQVDEKCLRQGKCPTPKIQIEEGLKVFKESLEKALESGIGAADAVTLTLFGYNRGRGAMITAIENYKKGITLHEAMLTSCRKYYGNEKDRNGNDKCTYSGGYGVYYPGRVLTHMTVACTALGADMENADISLSSVSGKVGTYSINPSFRVRTDHKLDEYDVIKKEAAELMDACSDRTAGLKACAAEKITEFNADNKLIWSIGACEQGVERVFNDFHQGIGACLDSPDDGCLCEIELDYAGMNVVLEDQVYSFEFGKDAEYFQALILQADEKYGDLLRKTVDARLFTGQSDGKNLAEIDAIKVDYKFDYAGELSSTFPQTSKIKGDGSKPEMIRQGTIAIRKDGINLTILDFRDRATGLESCSLSQEHKRALKFCVKSDKDEFYAYDPIVDKTEKKKLDYRFAIEFADFPPPIIENIEVLDQKMADNSMLISWDDPGVEDIYKFHIFYSDVHSLEKMNDETWDFDKFFTETELQVTFPEVDRMHNISSLDISSTPTCNYLDAEEICEFKYAALNFEDEQVVLNQGEIYYINDAKRYLYVLGDLDSDSGKDYTFTVVGEDAGGNLIREPSRYNYVDGKPVDDLAPGIVTTFISEDKGLITFNMNQPLVNIDGTWIDDFAQYRIYSSSSTFTSIKEAKLLTTSSIETYNKLFSTGTHYFAITASDTAGNYFENVPLEIITVGNEGVTLSDDPACWTEDDAYIC